ncbi:hypothetical protein VCHA53O466_50111 [Vibrio chagasii]|nr:hypothetical protein VCHA53O466_50111 [Vibrio chagasii]
MPDIIKAEKSQPTAEWLHKFYKCGRVHLHGLDNEVCDMPFSFDHLAMMIPLPNIYAVVKTETDGYHHHVFKGSAYLKAMFDFMDGSTATSTTFFEKMNGMKFSELPNVMQRHLITNTFCFCKYSIGNNEVQEIIKIASVINPHSQESLKLVLT